MLSTTDHHMIVLASSLAERNRQNARRAFFWKRDGQGHDPYVPPVIDSRPPVHTIRWAGR